MPQCLICWHHRPFTWGWRGGVIRLGQDLGCKVNRLQWSFFVFFLNVQPKCFSTPSSWPISCGIHDSASTSYQRENTHIYSKLSSSCSQPTKLNKTIYGKKIPYQFTPVCFFCRLTEGNLIHWICTGQCRTHEGEVGGQGGRGGEASKLIAFWWCHRFRKAQFSGWTTAK